MKKESILKKSLLPLIFFATFFCFHPQLRAFEPAPFRLGLSLALSGKLSFVGQAELHGYQLAVSELNALGGIEGRQLELVVEDNGGDPRTALTSVSKMLDLDKVEVILTGFSHIVQGVKDRVKRAGKLMIYQASIGDVAAENPLFFRDWGDAEEQARAVLDRIIKDGRKRIVYLGEIHEGCNLVLSTLQREAPKRGLKILAEHTFVGGETDFKTFLLKIRQDNPEALFSCTWRDGALFMSHMKTLNMLNLPTYQFLTPLLSVNNTAEARALYEENKTITAWMGFVPGQQTEKMKAFFSRLQTNTGDKESRFESLFAYEELLLLADAAKGCFKEMGFDAQCAAKNLQASKRLGVDQELTFNSSRQMNRETMLMTVQNGQWVRVH